MRQIASHAAAALSGAAIASALLLVYEDAKKERRRPVVVDGVVDGGDTSFGNVGAGIAAPTLPLRIFRPNRNLEIAFDTRTRNPAYVVERLVVGRELKKCNSSTIISDDAEDDATQLIPAESSSGRVSKASREGKRFFEEKSLPPAHRSRNGYYRNTRYDRGHLAPAADFRHSDEEMADTFTLCNVSPQDPYFNRMVWSRLEDFVRRIAREEEESTDDFTYVVTGPLWLPSNTIPSQDGLKEEYQFSNVAIGSPPSLVSVPTHFFKVVAVLKEEGNSQTLVKFAAFVLPNQNNDRALNLQHCVVRLSDLEAVTGMQFFPKLWGSLSKDSEVNSTQDRTKVLADALTEKVWTETPGSSDALVVSSHSISQTALSKRRRQKMNQILRDCRDLYLQHVCTGGKCNEVINSKSQKKT